MNVPIFRSLKKQARLSYFEQDNPDIGDQFLFVAMDQKTKLIPSFVLGKRNREVTEMFIQDLSERLVTPQLHEAGPRPRLSRWPACCWIQSSTSASTAWANMLWAPWRSKSVRMALLPGTGTIPAWLVQNSMVAYSLASWASWEKTVLGFSQSTPPFFLGYPQLLAIAPFRDMRKRVLQGSSDREDLQESDIAREIHRPKSVLLTDWGASLFDGAVAAETSNFIDDDCIPP
jgi:hypothetical protein